MRKGIKRRHDDEAPTTKFRNFDDLPLDFLAMALSRTTPRDAFVSYAVSRTFHSAANFETVWECFFPSDYASFLRHAVNTVGNDSMKDLFYRLCDHPVSIYGAKMAFGLEKSSGAKCFTISARAMLISFIDGNKYWKWVPLSNSRFTEAAEFIYDKPSEFQLNFRGRIPSAILSSDTTYAAYLIYEWKDYLIPGASLLKCTVEIGGAQTPNGTVCLDPEHNISKEEMQSMQNLQDIKWSKIREDGWREVKLGEFYIKNGAVDEKVKIILHKNEGAPIASVLILGMEIRPFYRA